MRNRKGSVLPYRNACGEVLHNNFRGEILFNSASGDILGNDACSDCGDYSNFLGIGDRPSPIVRLAIGVGIIIVGAWAVKRILFR